MPAPEGYCWLCKRYGKLTREHIPPESAFNDFPMLLQRIDERSSKSGSLNWTEGDHFERGLYFRSLCAKCNNEYGRLYGGAYVDLVRRVAERIADVEQFHTISLLGVKRPLAVLKQIILQFVTANGEGFVRANPWVAQFIRSRHCNAIPTEVGVYVFASNLRGARTSGVSAHINLAEMTRHIVSEFSFWPLGTVLSFGELADPRLTPIHQWAQHSFNYTGSVDLHLSVNPIASAYPVDFRTASQMQADSLKTDINIKRPAESDSQELVKRAVALSGTDHRNWFFSGHPNTIDKIVHGQ